VYTMYSTKCHPSWTRLRC